jgi:hypothetical protein
LHKVLKNVYLVLQASYLTIMDLENFVAPDGDPSNHTGKLDSLASYKGSVILLKYPRFCRKPVFVQFHNSMQVAGIRYGNDTVSSLQ